MFSLALISQWLLFLHKVIAADFFARFVVKHEVRLLNIESVEIEFGGFDVFCSVKRIECLLICRFE